MRQLQFGEEGSRGVAANVLDWGIEVNSNTSQAITFTFGLIILRKEINPSYGIINTSLVLLQEWIWIK